MSRPLHAKCREAYRSKVSIWDSIDHLVWVMGQDGKVFATRLKGRNLGDDFVTGLEKRTDLNGLAWWPYDCK